MRNKLCDVEKEWYRSAAQALDHFHAPLYKQLSAGEMEGIVSSGFCQHFLTLFLWVQRKASEKGKTKSVLENMDEMLEFTEGNPPLRQSVSYPDFVHIYHLAEKLNVIKKGWLPSKEEINEFFRPTIAHGLGFCLVLLSKNRKLSDMEEYQMLHRVVSDYYTVEEPEKKYQIAFDKFEKLSQEMEGYRFQKGNWWPTKEEVEYYIRPNFEICFDFIIWILESNNPPSTSEEREVYHILNQMVEQNTLFLEGDPVKW